MTNLSLFYIFPEPNVVHLTVIVPVSGWRHRGDQQTRLQEWTISDVHQTGGQPPQQSSEAVQSY